MSENSGNASWTCGTSQITYGKSAPAQVFLIVTMSAGTPGQ